METKVCTIALENDSTEYDVEIGHHLLAEAGKWARKCVSQETQTLAIISNKKVFDLYGESTRRSLKDAGFDLIVFLMEDGEENKSFASFTQVLEFLSENKIKRTDALLALGGGVVGDLAGFAASVYLRGISFLSIPTTFLSMIDSSVGGKTAINTSFGKNIVGTFYQPKGVLIDVITLQTLEKREVLAGFCEAIKHGAIGGFALLNEVDRFLSDFPLDDFDKHFNEPKFLARLEAILVEHVSFKAEVVTNDSKEATERIDAKSRKILNFGHTVGHSLEKVTGYKYFKHGEAVGYGMLVAAEISKKLDILDNNSLNLLKRVVYSAGKLPDARAIKIREIANSFSFDKKSLGDSLQWILLEEIGKPKIVYGTEIPESIIIRSLQEILHQ